MDAPGLARAEAFAAARHSPFHISKSIAPIFPPIVAVLPRRERAPLGFLIHYVGASALGAPHRLTSVRVQVKGNRRLDP